MHSDKFYSLFMQILQQLQKMPVAHTRPLLINDEIVGYAHPQACQVLKHYKACKVTNQAVFINTPLAELDALLATIAAALYEANCTFGWRDELLTVYGKQGPIAKMERVAFRALGLLTEAVHLNAYTPDDKIYLARRSPNKQTDPNLWDTLVGGLVNCNDTIEQALLRESFEEAGLHEAELESRSPSNLAVRLYRPLPEGYQIENLWFADTVISPDVELKNQDGEVSEIAVFTPEQTIKMIQQGELTVEAALVICYSLSARLR